MQKFQVYKIFETVNNYYFYAISHVDDKDIVLMQFEHTSAIRPDEPLYKYLNTAVGWDNINIEKCDDINAIDIINGSLKGLSDDKCMNNNNTFMSLIPEKKKKEKVVKEKKEKPIKEKKEKVVKEKKTKST